ncbi:MAG: c-type cytochrome [Planctomycetes bacterium]|nr:c-type cytochrome [Planctomycetota bacterium]
MAAAILGALGFAARAQHPVVPGVERLRKVPGSTPAERGAVLLDELACTACHASPGAGQRVQRGPDLTEVGARVSPAWLRRFLTEPNRVKPGTTMPQCMPEEGAATRAGHVDDLVRYLASRGGPLQPATTGARAIWIERGRELYHSVGCVACHAPEDGRATAVPSIPLGELAAKTTVDSLAAFLRDPQRIRPAGRMPKLWLEEDEAQALAMYLLRAQATAPHTSGVRPPPRAGLRFAIHTAEGGSLPVVGGGGTAVRAGVAERVRLPEPEASDPRALALWLGGDLWVPETGAYTFYWTTEGPARFSLDGEVVLATDRGGESTAQLELTLGKHRVELVSRHRTRRSENRERAKGSDGGEKDAAGKSAPRAKKPKAELLRLRWSGPGFGRTEVANKYWSNRLGRAMVPVGPGQPPEELDDPASRERGRELFKRLRCVACHEPRERAPSAADLADLDPTAARGCLSRTSRGVSFGLSELQRTELRAALTARVWAAETTATVRLRHRFASFNCLACHVRDGVGGPDEARGELFTTRTNIDLGDEGRLPPTLVGAGDKLRPEALQGILARGDHHVRRRFMNVRMPGFPVAVAQQITRDLVAVDRSAPAGAPPVFSPETAEVGRRLVGMTGFACVTCHNVNGARSPAIQGVDLAGAHKRLNSDWFRRFLRAPSKFRDGTRMPGYWSSDTSLFTDLLGGSSARQIDAVWSYLSLGRSIRAPVGMARSEGGPEFELVPKDEPIVHRTFMKDVGGRAILVGFPERLHVAFDAQGVWLAKAWRGRFFDAGGVASGRTGKFLGPLGGDVLDLPGPSFAVLPRPDAPWPRSESGARSAAFRGYTLEQGRRPVFLYRVGSVAIREQPLPVLDSGGAILRRVFELDAARSQELQLLLWRGGRIEAVQGGWRSGAVRISWKTPAAGAPRVCKGPGGDELRLGIALRGSRVRCEVEVRW